MLRRARKSVKTLWVAVDLSRSRQARALAWLKRRQNQKIDEERRAGAHRSSSVIAVLLSSLAACGLSNDLAHFCEAGIGS